MKTRPVIAAFTVVAASMLLFAAIAVSGGSEPSQSEPPPGRGVTATAGPVEVEGAVQELGHVPLDTTVEPSWVLRNTGDAPVTLGEPHAEVRAGCCPGPLVLDAPEIPPGGEVGLAFPLQMHEGMDGPHDFAIHVPVEGAAEPLTLQVTADFGG